MDKRKGNVTLCWVLGHAGITGNEEADKRKTTSLGVDLERRKVPTRGLKRMD
jgi:ribonuclease HI